MMHCSPPSEARRCVTETSMLAVPYQKWSGLVRKPWDKTKWKILDL